MSLISIIHPTRSRVEMSKRTIDKWRAYASELPEVIISIDSDDPSLDDYLAAYPTEIMVISPNKSAVEAINRGAEKATGDILIVVSDDTDVFLDWNTKLLEAVNRQSDFILKTKDGIQDYIITMPVLDRAYYNRFGYIYDPAFSHMFCDTWLTIEADISGRKLKSNLLFPHLNDSIKDDLRARTDATWANGEKVFISKLQSTRIEDLKKITDLSMRSWIRNKAGIKI